MTDHDTDRRPNPADHGIDAANMADWADRLHQTHPIIAAEADAEGLDAAPMDIAAAYVVKGYEVASAHDSRQAFAGWLEALAAGIRQGSA